MVSNNVKKAEIIILINDESANYSFEFSIIYLIHRIAQNSESVFVTSSQSP